MLLFLTALTAHATRTPSGACRHYLVQVDHLRQFYAGGDPMQLRVPAIPDVLEGFTLDRVYEAASRKLSAHGLHDADAPQWLDVGLTVGATQFTVIPILRRWAVDLGYGLPDEMSV